MIPLCPDAASCVVLRTTIHGSTEQLLVRRSEQDGGFWSHVGGGVESGETAVQTILRELYEETGLRPSAFYNAHFVEQFYQVKQNRILIMPAFVAFVDSQATVTLNEEHSEFDWCSLESALHRVPFAGQQELYRHVWRLFVDRAPSDRLKIPVGTQND